MTRATELAVSDKAVQDFVVRGEVTDAEVLAGAAVGKKWMSLARVFAAITKMFATQVQVDARADDATIVTPKRMGWGFSLSLNFNGYVIFPTWMGSFIIQWGQLVMTSGLTTQKIDFNFPLAFPSACLHLTGTIGVYIANYDAHPNYRIDRQEVSFGLPSNTACHAQSFNVNNLEDARIVRWLAIGR